MARPKYFILSPDYSKMWVRLYDSDSIQKEYVVQYYKAVFVIDFAPNKKSFAIKKYWSKQSNTSRHQASDPWKLCKYEFSTLYW